MSKMILNEKEYIRNLIEENNIRKNNNSKKDKKKELKMDISKSQLIHLLARYFYEEDILINKLYTLVSNQMKDFEFKDYYESKWYNSIMKACDIVIKYKIKAKENEKISLYESELDNIKKCNSDRHKKLLFAIYIIARYKEKNGKIDKQIMKKEIFDCANINGTKKDKAILINELWKDGFIEQNFINDDISISIKLSNGTEEEVLQVTSLKNLGNQILAYLKDDYKQCTNCGKLIKIKGKNSQYCDECAEKIESEKNRLRVEKFRNNQKCNGF